MSLYRFAGTIGTLVLALATLNALPVYAADTTQSAAQNTVLPRPTESFKGKLAPTESDSTSSFPVQLKAPAGAPNILLVMTDDVGFASASTFGGPIPTPNLDRLAAHGLKYNQFHTTAICSPSRAALLTGRNHHAVGTGMLADVASPYPGYTMTIPRSAATVARVLRDNGYNTAMFGKDHNVPGNQRSAAGPFEQWPSERGFEHFYGFIAGDTDQWRPSLYDGKTPVDGSRRPANYILDRDLADHTIEWLHNQKAAAPDKPFFIYYAPGSPHAPHQAPADWIAKFRGKFDQGWDRQREESFARQKALGIIPATTDLVPRPAEIPAWDSLSAEEKRINARYMEVFAGMLAFQDAQIGRLLDELERMGISDNTLIAFIEGDNGAAAEGGPKGTLNEIYHLSVAGAKDEDPQWLARHLDLMGGPKTFEAYPIGWAFALNTPFPWLKQVASHLGGTRNGLVISWPDRIKAHNEVRTQYHHIIDVMPTLLEAAQVQAPTMVDGIAQQRIDGTSMVYSFDAANAPSQRTTQYYEIMGSRGIYHDGWLANTTPRNLPWNIAQIRTGSDTSTYQWELYDLTTDFSQAHNLAAAQPERLQQMQAIFDEEARRNNVYPIHDSSAQTRGMKMMRATGSFRSNYVYWGPNIRLPLMASPPIFNLPFSLTAEIDIPKSGATGVIAAAGSFFGGWSFYLKDGKPIAYAAASHLPGEQYRVAASKPLAAGPNSLRFDFAPEKDGGVVTITVNGNEVARQSIASYPHMMAGTSETFDIGRDSNSPVSEDYAHEGVFSGEIKKVEVKLKMPSAAAQAPAAPK